MRLVIPKDALGLDEELVVVDIIRGETFGVQDCFAKTEDGELVLLGQLTGVALVRLEQNDAPPKVLPIAKDTLERFLQQLGFVETVTTVVSRRAARSDPVAA